MPPKTNEEWVEEFYKKISNHVTFGFLEDGEESEVSPLYFESPLEVAQFEKEFKNWLLALLTEKDKEREEAVADIIGMADALELECSKDGDKGTKQWMAFKVFRNTIRDRYLTPPDTPPPHKQLDTRGY